METPPGFLILVYASFGLVVGSFLNVAIHRLPLENETVSKPRRSRCPSCRTELGWRDNIPVLSWALLRGKCRACRWPIPVRYPLVELLTALLWSVAAWLGPDGWSALVAVQALVLAGLIVATFVDFDHFEIPDEVSIGGMVLAPILSFLVPELHAATSLAASFSADQAGGGVDRLGALLASLAGLAVGGGVLLVLGMVGSKLFGRDAMGFGDVKLLAAGGGFIGPGGALVALLIGALVASVAGILNMVRFFYVTRGRARARGAEQSLGKAVRVARVAGRYLPFGPYLGIGIGIVMLDWNHVVELWTQFVF